MSAATERQPGEELASLSIPHVTHRNRAKRRNARVRQVESNQSGSCAPRPASPPLT
jgi:hypothetical protein